jgi:hypothetical protein
MNIPNVPTDNLYKFIALTGVILLLLSILYPELKKQELTSEITLLNGEINKIDYEMLPIEEQSLEIKNKIAELDKACNCGAKSVMSDTLIVRTHVIKGPKELVDMSKQIDTLLAKYDQLVRAISFKIIEVDTKKELIENKKKDLSDIDYAASIFGPTGLLISIIGFGLWLFMTQAYQDALLKMQYEQVRKNERCQSCGMNFANDEKYDRLSKDEQQKMIYCSNCHSGDGFLEPELTFSQMKDKVRARCLELGYGKIATYIYLFRLNDLDRWRIKFKWK